LKGINVFERLVIQVSTIKQDRTIVLYYSVYTLTPIDTRKSPRSWTPIATKSG